MSNVAVTSTTESAEVIALRAEVAALRAAQTTPAAPARKPDPFVVRIDILYPQDATREPTRILRFVDTTTGVETAYWINGRHDSDLAGEKRSGKRVSFFLSPMEDRA